MPDLGQVRTNLENIALGIAAAATLSSLLAAASRDLFSSFKRILTHAGLLTRSSEVAEIIIKQQNPSRPSSPRLDRATTQVLIRLKEARNLQRKKQSAAVTSTWSARSLTFGQYVIGGVLASSFVQQQRTPQIVGGFGVLVLLASLITQHYHPELTAQAASRIADQLGALIRESEDRIVVIETQLPHDLDGPRKMLELLEKISAELKAITLAAPMSTSEKPRKAKAAT